MANPEHIRLLQSTAEAWNEWREGNPEITPDLANADLRAADLSGRILTASDLTEADLTDATIRECLLGGAKLIRTRAIRTDFSKSHLEWLDAYQANLSEANLIRCLAEKVSFEDTKSSCQEVCKWDQAASLRFLSGAARRPSTYVTP